MLWPYQAAEIEAYHRAITRRGRPIHAASGNREVLREGSLVLWAADGPAGERYAAAFNLGSTPLPVALDAANLDCRRGLPVRFMSCGRGRWCAPVASKVSRTVRPHGAALLRYDDSRINASPVP